MLTELVLICTAGMKMPAPVTALKAKTVRLCGGHLNPREHGEAMRFATSFLYSCKGEIRRMNIPSVALENLHRACTAFRMCYAVIDDNSNATVTHGVFVLNCMQKLLETLNTVYPHFTEKYKIDAQDMFDALRRCAGHLLPRDGRYMLACISYLEYFLTG
ncbi:uncharacterized protein LOC142786413 isoform X1 [Rhipicephalus microplus]|uniref:uncharacterized protein LOC142786413 isoform X1 n=1 Tax=Rhipicephalus microplus TaxID=6941 RepID=UPI003F6B81DA